MIMDLYTNCPECDIVDLLEKRYCERCQNSRVIPVRVKALEWDDMLSATPYYRSVYDIYVSDTRTDVIDAEHSCEGDIGTFTTISAAKAACQEHHERMVMAMMEITS